MDRHLVEVFTMCGVTAGESAAILSETQSRAVNVNLAELALVQLGARPFHISVPTPRLSAPVPIRSTGASDTIGQLEPVVGALANSGIVIDCTVEGLLHAVELPQILKGGARVLMVSNEHPEALERLKPTPDLEPKVKAGIKKLIKASSDTSTRRGPNGSGPNRKALDPRRPNRQSPDLR